MWIQPYPYYPGPCRCNRCPHCGGVLPDHPYPFAPYVATIPTWTVQNTATTPNDNQVKITKIDSKC